MPRIGRLRWGSSDYRDAVLNSLGLIGYWRLGEASGTVARDEMGMNNGAYINAPTLGVAGALAGDPDPAVTLNGTTQYVTVPDAASLDLGNAFTLMAWIRHTASASVGSIITKGIGAYQMVIDANVLFLALQSSLALASSGAVTLTTGIHHCAVTKDGAARGVYIDGADVTSLIANDIGANTATALLFGTRGVVDQFFSGDLDEVAIFNRALTAAEVTDLYRIGMGR